MTRAVCLFMVCVLVVMMIGCTPRFIYNPLSIVTEEYQRSEFFANHHKTGMDKAKVVEQLGTPDGHGHIKDYTCHTSRYSVDFPDHVMEQECVTWIYCCRKFNDSEEYELIVKFDNDGKTVSASLVGVPGN